MIHAAAVRAGSAVLGLLVLAACSAIGEDGPQVGESAPVSEAEPTPAPLVDTVASGLVVPWGVALAPDGRIFVTERTGRLRVITRDGLRPEPLLTLDVHAEHPSWHPESGLMGIALAPDFEQTGHAYLLATFVRDGSRAGTFQRLLQRVRRDPEFSAAQLPFENRVLRVTIGEERADGIVPIVVGLPTNHYHAGGAIAFGPDGKLYVSVGDARTPALAQEPGVLVGKILRFEPDGSVPADNPVPGSPVWARGLRNTQGLAWHPDGTLFGIDHGPSGLPDEKGATGHDELNVLRRGGNYGWPMVSGDASADGSERPIRTWASGVAPAGLAYVATAGPWQGDLLVGRLRGGLERLEIARNPDWRVTASETIALPTLRRIRTVVVAPDGSLYITTSNRDIRGVAGAADDLLLRVRPADVRADMDPSRRGSSVP